MSAAIASGTGGSVLPDTGQLTYNGIRFSSLYHSIVSAQMVQDDAKRVVKYTEYTLRVLGVVTLNDGDIATDATWLAIRRALEVQGAALIYQGNGYGQLNINNPGSIVTDVVYGPIPKVLSFEPFGPLGSRIEWECTVAIPEVQRTSGGSGVLQWNWESSVQFDDAGYSSLNISGIVEIAIARAALNVRTITSSVDDFRDVWEAVNIDFSKFRVTHRSFDVSSDKRTGRFSYRAEELPPCGLPPGCLDARGNMSVRKMGGSKLVAGCVQWVCTLTASYVVAGNQPRRVAAENFMSLLSWRMQQSVKGQLPAGASTDPNGQQPGPSNISTISTIGTVATALGGGTLSATADLIGLLRTAMANRPATITGKALLIDFGFTEGVYLDGKQVSFTASWMLLTTFTTLLQASGIWTFPAEVGGETWSKSVGGLQGTRSWLRNRLNPAADAIVDFSGGFPPNTKPVT